MTHAICSGAPLWMMASQCLRTLERESTRTLLQTARQTKPRPVISWSQKRRNLSTFTARLDHNSSALTQSASLRLSSPSSTQRRAFSSNPSRKHGDIIPPKPGEERRVTFIDKDNQHHTFEVGDGNNLLDIAQANDLEMEGACGGSVSCSTCHVIVQSEEDYYKMGEPSDEENDMLDMAFGLTMTSRLGCQVQMSKEIDGLVVKLPTATRNLQASDFEQK